MSLAVYGIAFLVLIASIIGGIAVHDHGIRAAQKTADEAAVTAAQTNTATCMASNKTLVKSTLDIAKQRDVQSAEVLRWQGLEQAAKARADKALAERQPLLAQLSQTQKDARDKAARPVTPGETYEQMCAEIDTDSKTFAVEFAK